MVLQDQKVEGLTMGIGKTAGIVRVEHQHFHWELNGIVHNKLVSDAIAIVLVREMFQRLREGASEESALDSAGLEDVHGVGGGVVSHRVKAELDDFI